MMLRHHTLARGLLVALILGLAASAPVARAQDPEDDEEAAPVEEAVAAKMIVNANAPNAEQFDQWVFNRAGGAAAARNRLDTLLALNIEQVNRLCAISEGQTKKLQLAGRGDIKRFFDKVDEAKRRFLLASNNQNNNIWMEINPLQTALSVGIFGDDSIFAKSIKTTLSNEQAARYAAIQQERKQTRYRTTVEWWVVQVDKSLGLSAEARRRLSDLLFKEGRPPRRYGQGDYWYIMFQAAQIPEAQLEPIFDKVQWRLLGNQLNQARGMEQWLKQNGTIPE
jgi:hypothetical protein